MATPGVVLKRSVIFVHRWMGVVLCVVFFLWFVSGIVMMYWSFPEITTADRLRRSPILNPAQIRLSPEQAYAAVHSGEPLGRAQLTTFDGRPVYDFTTLSGTQAVIHADDGTEQVDVSEGMVDRAAAIWTGQAASTAVKVPIEEVDQWTVQGGLRYFRPLWKYSFPNGEEVYVSGTTAQAVQYTTRQSRFWAYLGAIPHWLYVTPLRKHQPQWSLVVIWASGIGTVAALLGLVIGVWMYSPSKRYSNSGAPTSIPYRGQKRWHLILGLIFGSAAASWAFSGMLSMDPFSQRTAAADSSVEGEPANIDISGALRGNAQFDLAAYARRDPRDAISALGSDFKVKRVEFTSFAGEAVYLAVDGQGHSRIIPLTGQPMVEFDHSRIMDLVSRAAGPALGEMRVMTDYDAYYLDRTGRLPLPVICVRLNDKYGTRYYIDTKTARVAGQYDSRQWVNRWLYHGLHSFNFPWLYKHRPLWDVTVISLMLGGAALCVTSLILAWRVLKRKLLALLPIESHERPSVASEDLNIN